MSDPVVRRAAQPELQAIGALTLEAYRGAGFLSADSDYLDELLDAADRHRNAELWVAADAEALLGTVTFCPVGSPYREVAVDDSEAEFRMLAVSPRARRRGVARMLTLHCLARAAELGHRRLVLCSERRMTAAQQLYVGLGFTRLPDRDWSPRPGVDLLGFGLDL